MSNLTKKIDVDEYIKNLRDSNDKEFRIKQAYFTALARERYNTTKLSDVINSN